MAQTATTLANVLKEVWTDDALQKQFFADDGPLNRIEQVSGTMIGSQASIPVWNDLNSGGYTSVGSGGPNTLNTATNQPTQKAFYTLVYHWFPISIDTSALNQSAGPGMASTVSAKNLEITGAIASLRNQATRQVVTNGDGIVAGCGSATSATVPLVASPNATNYGYDAIVRNWLRPGAVVDIGTTADTDALVTATTVTAVAESASAPTITIGTSITTVAGTHFVYIANPNSATAANPELNGLRNLINSSGAVGGLNPATAGQEFWQAALRDTTTNVFSLDLALNLNRAVVQKSGKKMSDVWTGLKQQQNFYSLLQNQVRFAGDLNLSAGNSGLTGDPSAGPTWNGMAVNAFPAILDSDWYCLTVSDLARIVGQGITKPTWASDLGGDSSPGGMWHQGFTDFVDAVVYPFQLGMRRRNTSAAATALIA